MTKMSLWDRREPVLTPRILAYHEGAHAVVAHGFGWQVEEIHIDCCPCVWLEPRKNVYNEEENPLYVEICVDMAGLVAEETLLGVDWAIEEEIIDELRAILAGDCARSSDTHSIAMALLDDNTEITLAGAGALRPARAGRGQ
jgi:hypothetical protein